MRVVTAGVVAGIFLVFASSSPSLVGLWDRARIGDIAAYRHDGELIRAGQAPYRDFYLEYPPGALPMFVAPTLAGRHYDQAFRLLSVALAAAAIPLLAFALLRLGAPPRRIAAVCIAAGLAPLALGAPYVVNFDTWPALLTAAAIALLAAGRRSLAAGVLGLGFATKVYPLVLLPVLLAVVWPRRLRALLWPTVAFGAVAAAVLLPFAALAPGGVGYSLYVQAKRPLQVESLGASLLLAAHQLGLYGGSINSIGNSQNLSGGLARGLAALTLVLLVSALVGVWWLCATGRLGLVDALAAAVVAYVAFGKVLSPQYLIWLVPVVLLTTRAAPIALLAAAMVLTHVWFPDRYGDVVSFGAAGWLVLARNLVLVALFAVLVTRARVRGGAAVGAPPAWPRP
jgi:uncharacterized membrane protein